MIFLSYAKEDGDHVRRIHARLQKDGLQPWLDEHDLLPGQDWERVIQSAIRRCNAFLVFLSKNAVSKTGYIQKEIREALEVAERKPDDKVFIIPARLEDCIVPERLQRWQWLDLFDRNGYARLLAALRQHIGTSAAASSASPPVSITFAQPADYFLYDLFLRAGRLLYARLGRKRFVLSQGHFALLRTDMPQAFLDLKGTIADFRHVRPKFFETILPPTPYWRTPGALVNRIANTSDRGVDLAIIGSRELTCGVNVNYWKLAQLYTSCPRYYLTGERKPIYVEQDDEVVAILMPFSLTDAERAIFSAAE